MPRKLLKLKNYDIHSICSFDPDTGKLNANIAMWVMASSLDGKLVTIALENGDYTLELIQKTPFLTVNLLAEQQTRLINKLGRRSGRQTDKFKNLAYGLDSRNCPFLRECIGYLSCEAKAFYPSGDHTLVLCEIVSQKVLHPELNSMSLNFLREKKLVRG